MKETPREVLAELTECPDCRTTKQPADRCCRKCARTFPAATWLFEGVSCGTGKKERPEFMPPREGFTTSLFALYLLNSKGRKTFPLRQVRENFRCIHTANLDLGGATFQQMAIDPRAGGADLIVTTPSGCAHIENKPWAGESGREGAQLEELARSAEQSGATFCVLISCGNPQDPLWNVIMEKRYPVLLWEEVLERMDEAGFARELVEGGGTLEPYYKLYVR